MSASENGGDNLGSVGKEDREHSRSWWLKVAVVSVLAPVVGFIVSVILLITAVNNLDVASALGVSDAFAMGIPVVSGGVLAGLVVGLVAGIRGKKLAVPPMTGVIVGIAIYLAFLALDMRPEAGWMPFWAVWAGQSVGIFLATWLAGFALAAAAVVAILVGVGTVAAIEALPEPPLEVFLVLNDYTVDETTGECSGSGALASVVEGSRVSLIDSSGPIIDLSATPVESRVLPSGTAITRDADPAFLFAATNQDAGCLFIWADPGLELSDYWDVYPIPESGDLDAGWGIHVSGQRVVFTLGSGGEVPGGGEPEDAEPEDDRSEG